jgi:hypothetical protein
MGWNLGQQNKKNRRHALAPQAPRLRVGQTRLGGTGAWPVPRCAFSDSVAGRCWAGLGRDITALPCATLITVITPRRSTPHL